MLDINTDKGFVEIKEELIPEATSTLNEKQLKTFHEILEFFKHPERRYYVLEGYAGTGKTYLLSKVVSVVKGKVAMTAPTNKAVKVLAENRASMDGQVDYATIHKLLALTLQWVYPDKKQGQTFEPYQKLTKKKFGEVMINDYSVLIVDEVSMLDDQLLIMINEEAQEGLKVIFMGDPAQIPPVNQIDSKPLLQDGRAEYGMQHQSLERIMRQSGDNKILEIAYQIRNGRFSNADPVLSRLSNKDVHFYSSLSKDDKDEFVALMLYLFNSKRFQDDANFCKAIAWTNKIVNGLNTMIRRYIYKGQELKQLMLGEKLIADSVIMDELGRNIKFNTSDEFTIVELEDKVYSYFIENKTVLKEQITADFVDDVEIKDSIKNAKGVTYNLSYYECKVAVKDPFGGTYYDSIDVLKDESDQAFKWALGKLKGQQKWREKVRLQERFAKVKYNYAITAHKAQGSTYGIVFLMEDDIDNNPKTLERNRIKYTASTRPKYQLHILGKRNIKRVYQREELLKSGISTEELKKVFGY